MLGITFFGENIFDFFHSLIGILSFISLYAFWVILLLPGLWPSMLAGVIYGSFLGSVFVFLGAFLGAQITFLLGRKFFKKSIQRRISTFPKFEAVQKAVSKEGLKLVILTRLSPAFPFSLLNLIYSLSDVSLRDFTIGLIAIFPGTLLFCGLGAVAGDIAKFNAVLDAQKDTISLTYSCIGVVATFLVVFLVAQTSNKILKEFDQSL